MAYEEDIKRRTWIAWLKAHTTGFKPLHRYKGVLEVKDNELIFNGRDVKENKEFQLKIPLKDIKGLRYGFDEFSEEGKRGPGHGTGH